MLDNQPHAYGVCRIGKYGGVPLLLRTAETWGWEFIASFGKPELLPRLREITVGIKDTSEG